MAILQKILNTKLFKLIRKHGIFFIAGLLAAVLLFILTNIAMEPFSKSSYCGSKCHEMNTAYKTWELSPHGSNARGIRVECIDCHLPPKEKFFTHVTAKTYTGCKDIYMHKFGPEYDLEHTRQFVLDNLQNKTCLHCHDDLLAKPASSASLKAHKAVLAAPDKPENRCTKCHENVGHQRLEKLFSK